MNCKLLFAVNLDYIVVYKIFFINLTYTVVALSEVSKYGVTKKRDKYSNEKILC